MHATARSNIGNTKQITLIGRGLCPVHTHAHIPFVPRVIDIVEQKQSRKRVGISGMAAPAREGTEIFDADGKEKIGKVRSHACPVMLADRSSLTLVHA